MTKWKYITLIFIMFFVFLIGFQKLDQYAITKELPLLGKIIYIDAGHGGRDPGTMYQDIKEKEINLEISKVLEEALLEKGAIVYQIREKDEDLSSEWDAKKKRGDLYRRIQRIEKGKSDLYLSIHINWYMDPNYGGAEVLYYPSNEKNQLLGQSIMDEFQNELKSPRNLKTTDLYLYKNIKTPGVLIECGFLSNPNERRLLLTKDYQTKIAKAITKGVETYFIKLSEI